jgi:hypothetical protein
MLEELNLTQALLSRRLSFVRPTQILSLFGYNLITVFHFSNHVRASCFDFLQNPQEINMRNPVRARFCTVPYKYMDISIVRGPAIVLRRDRTSRENFMATKSKRWVAKVKTDSTHPPAGLFTKGASTIARVLASKRVSPKGPQSGLRMLTYFINRGGRGLNTSRRATLERAKVLMEKQIRRATAPEKISIDRKQKPAARVNDI